MMLNATKNMLDKQLGAILDKYESRLPFRGLYLRRIREALVKRLDSTKAQWDTFFDNGDADKLVDFLMDLIRGNLGLPFFLKPFEKVLLDGVGALLKANLPLMRNLIGASYPRPVAAK